MNKLIMTKGLPGSGKTTWAKQYQKEHPDTKRVNRDDLRAMLDDGQWSKENEKRIRDVRDYLVSFLLSCGHDVILDDTNLDPANESHIRGMIREMNEERIAFRLEPIVIEAKNFDTSVEECIERDSKREGRARVGEEVIRRFYTKYVAATTK